MIKIFLWINGLLNDNIRNQFNIDLCFFVTHFFNPENVAGNFLLHISTIIDYNIYSCNSLNVDIFFKIIQLQVLRSKISTAKVSNRNRYMPKAFTEKGLSLLS